ncbi:MAG: glucose/arabinose dehydrogenase [Planctomycetota bacterium]|jgi:glucose/arabinose dehydrogenase
MSSRLLTSLLAGATVVGALAAPTQAQDFEAVRVLNGLNSPVLLTSAPGDVDRMFVVQQGGLIRVVRNGAINATPFLNLSSIISTGSERGLLGLAFHPDFANNGRFFVNYTNAGGGATKVREYHVSGNAMTNDVADPVAVQMIESLSQPFSNHNGGMIAFSPIDGMLYVGMGDGGSGGDPQGNGQNGLTNLGKILRFNVDLPAPFVDPSNPFVGNGSVNDEIWATGIRNPWRFSFDRLTGDMWVGDVGQNAIEEINFEAAGDGGRNYGWRCMEGNSCTGLSGCTCQSAALTDPVKDFNHSGGNCSVTGGYRYRGSAIPSLQGTYFYGDYCSSKIWSFEFNGSSISNLVERTAQLEPALGTISLISSFGEDAQGEIYIIDYADGEIYKIVPTCGSSNYCSTAPNSAGSGAVMSSSGSMSVTTNTFTLSANGAAPNQPGLFYYGPNQTSQAFGDGFRCVGGSTFRLNPVTTSNLLGDNNNALDFTTGVTGSGPGQIIPGSTWNFQYWFRDPGGPGGTGYNLSNGLSALFCP